MSKKKDKTLYGLVLTGGRSSRMNMDKTILEFFGQSQTARAYELLSHFCEKVFISNREDQALDEIQRDFPQIHDNSEFSGIGPLGGILSAMKEYPDVSWLVLACDLPFVTKRTLAELIEKRDRQGLATAYRSVKDDLPEPLCAIYEASARKTLEKFCSEGMHCPRKIMITSNAKLVDQADPRALDNINSPQDYERALNQIKGDA